MLNQKRLLKPTLQITFFSCLGILISFATQIIVAAKFGVTMQRDAYFAAIVVPAYVTAVLLGSLTVTFVPIFIEYETRKSKREAWKVASIFTNLTFVVLFGISLLGFIFAKGLISITAPGFEGVTLSLTASLLRIILPSIIFSGLTSLLSSMYYAEHRFVRPAIVPVVSAVLMLLFVVLLARSWGIKSLAFGYLFGTFVSFLIVVPIFLKEGRYHFSFDLSNEGVRQVIRVITPLVLAGLFYRATTVIERMIASTLPTGSISYLGYANKITHILGEIATAGISTTIFPLMARGWAENDLAKVREYFAKGVRIIMLITFPIATVLVVLRVPIIQVVFERGEFDHNTTIAVANTLFIFLIAFVMMGLGNIVGRPFYVMQKTKLVAFLDVMFIILYTFMAYILARQLSYIGLAVALSIKTVLTQLTFVLILRKLWGGINGKQILDGGTKILIASFVACATIWASQKCLYGFTENLLISTGVSTFIGFTAYGITVTYIFKLQEMVHLKNRAVRRASTLLKGIAYEGYSNLR